MKPRLRLPLSIMVVALASVAGWLSRGAPEKSSAGISSPLPSANENGKAAARPPRGKSVPPEVAERLAFIRGAGGREEQRRAAIEVASSLSLEDLKAWYEEGWFEGDEDIQGQLLERIMRARWLAADPGGFMEICLGKDRKCSYDVALDWAELDPAAALAFATGSEEASRRRRLVAWMAEDLAKADPQLVLTKLPEVALSLGSGSNHVVAAVLDQLARAAPDKLRAMLAGWPPDLRGPAGTRLAGELLRRDFGSGLAELLKMEEGKDYFVRCATRDRGYVEWGDADEELMAAISKHADTLPEGWIAAVAGSYQGAQDLVKSDPGRWVELQAGSFGLDNEQAARLRRAAFEQLARKDLAQALDLFASREWTFNERRGAISAIAGAFKDRAQAEAWIAGLKDEDEVKAAEGAFQHGYEEDQQAKRSPAHLLAQLADDKSSLSYNQGLVTRRWGSEEVAKFTHAFNQLAPGQRQTVAGKLVGGTSIPAAIQAQAIDCLLADPSGTSPQLMGQTCKLAADWTDRDPVAAGDWVKSLPASDERLWAAKNVALRWAEYEPAAARRWAAGLPAAERSAVEAVLDKRP